MEFTFLKEKNELLKQTRNVSFEDAIYAITSGTGFYGETDNPNQRKYGGEKAFLVELRGYIHVVPYEKIGKRKIRLKTIIPDRDYNKRIKR